MNSSYMPADRLARALERNELFWRGELEETPLLWITAPDAFPGEVPPNPAHEELMWMDVDYVLAATESALSRTYYTGDALPVFNPWLGPDQFAAWLGANITIKPKQLTSWVFPMIRDEDEYPELRIEPNNRWWKIYKDTLKSSVEAVKDK